MILIALLSTCNHLAYSHGFYIGANLSINYLSGKRNDSAVNNTPIRVDLSSSKSVNVNKVYGGIFLGYLFRIQNFGFGPEFFYNYGTIENTISATHNDGGPGGIDIAFDIKHRLTANKGIDLRIGYFISSYFLNTLFGVNWQTINYQVTARRSNFGAGTYNEYSYRTHHKQRAGFSFGLGVQKQITENYDIGIEYKQTNYPRTKYEYSLQDATETKLTSDINYKIHSIGLRFIYKF